MISIQYNRIDTQCGWRQRRTLSPFFSSSSLSLSLSFSLRMGAQKRRRRKKIERNIKYWIRIVLYGFNNSTWFVVYECVYICGCSKGVRVHCSTQIFLSLSLSLSMFLFFFFLLVGSGMQALSLAERNREREETFLSHSPPMRCHLI